MRINSMRHKPLPVFVVRPWRMKFYSCSIPIVYASAPRRKSCKFPAGRAGCVPCSARLSRPNQTKNQSVTALFFLFRPHFPLDFFSIYLT